MGEEDKRKDGKVKKKIMENVQRLGGNEKRGKGS